MKEVAWFLLTIMGVHRFFRWKNRKKIIILMYHGVVKTTLKPFCWTQILDRKFDYHLNYLKRHYSILKLSEIVDRIQKGLPLPTNTAAVTFDDGYRNNFTIAYPLLRRLQIPATIFLVTGCISDRLLCWPDVPYLGIKYTGRKSVDLRQYGLKCYQLCTAQEKEIAEQEIVEYLKSIPYSKKDTILNEILKLLMVQADMKDPDFELLTWEEVKTMHDGGLIEFGAHTVTHNILSRMDDAEIEKEITASFWAIEDHLGSKCLLFAYPNGSKRDFTQRSKNILVLNGFKYGLSTISGLNNTDEDRYELKRIGIGADMSNARFKLLTSGALGYIKKITLWDRWISTKKQILIN